MAKVTLNPIFEAISGNVGDLVLRELRGQTIVSRKPALNGELSAAQIAHRDRFKRAVAYAKSVLADPAVRPVYEAVAFAKNTQVFALIIADFLNLPKIVSVDSSQYNGQAGGVIKVITTDDFGVANLRIDIYDADEGTDFESGQAVESPAGSGYWYYTTIANAPAGIVAGIQVTATDRPGGSATQRGTKQI